LIFRERRSLKATATAILTLIATTADEEDLPLLGRQDEGILLLIPVPTGRPIFTISAFMYIISDDATGVA